MPPTQASGRPPPAIRSGHRRKSGSLKPVLLFLWAVVLALMPFYYFPSGSPQISDYCLALLSGIVLLLGGRLLDRRFLPTARAIGHFVGYVVLVNIAWWLARGDVSFLVTSTFYVFNLLAFIGASIIVSAYPREFLRVTYYLVTTSIVVQAVIGFFVGGTLRGTIYFNTPNQLAYYGLGATTVAVILSQHLKGSRVYLGVVVLAGLYLQYIGVSRAGALSMGALLGAMFVRRPAALVAGGLLLASVFLLVDLDPQRMEMWEVRIAATEGESLSDHIQERGFNRIRDNPQHLIVGAGEGEYKRFNRYGLEMHSSLLTVLFCYGIVGLLLFSRVLWKVWNATGTRWGVYLVPLFLFGITHQGLRFRIFWLSFVICIAVAASEQRRRREPRRRSGART